MPAPPSDDSVPPVVADAGPATPRAAAATAGSAPSRAAGPGGRSAASAALAEPAALAERSGVLGLATALERLARSPGWLALTVAVISALPFLPALEGPFLFDDVFLISQNPVIRSFEHWPRWFTTDLWDSNLAAAQAEARQIYYRPLVVVLYAVDWALWGDLALPYHLENLVLHGLAHALLFRALLRWTGAAVPSALAAALFGVHPMRAESVAWISGRPDLLLLVFGLLALEGTALRLRGRRLAGLALELSAGAAALLSKEHAIVLPAFVFVEAWLAAGRPSLFGASRVVWLGSALPALGVALGYVAARLAFLPLTAARSPISLWERLPLVPEAYGYVATAVAWPFGLHLHYSRLLFRGRTLLHSAPHLALGAALLVAALALAFAARRRAPSATLAVAVFVASLVPMSNIVWTGLGEVIAIRYLYLPSLALAWLVALALRRWGEGALGRAVRAAAVAGVVVLSVAAFARTVPFRSAVEFWRYEQTQRPDGDWEDMLMSGDLAAGRPRRALERAKSCFDRTREVTSLREMRGRVTFKAIDALLVLTPDAEVDQLDAIWGFCEALLSDGEAPATLVHPQIGLTIDRRSRTFGYLRSHAEQLRVSQARIDSRLGRDDRALWLADDAIARCPRCAQIYRDVAPLFAVAGQHARAEELLVRHAELTGRAPDATLLERVRAARAAYQASLAAPHPSDRARLRATHYAVLLSYGRAARELMPHEAEIAEAPPEVRELYAQVCFLAGERAAAERALGGLLSAAERDARFAAWAASMDWVDRAE